MKIKELVSMNIEAIRVSIKVYGIQIDLKTLHINFKRRDTGQNVSYDLLKTIGIIII